MPLTLLQKSVAYEVVAYARREDLPAGSHLSEMRLSRVVRTSRFPIQMALTHLAELGIVQHDPNRGFFLSVPASSLSDFAKKLSAEAENPVYLRIADLRLGGKLPDLVTETGLIRVLKVSRNAVHKALSRIQQEGWVERRPGHGWVFLPMIDSLEAYEESYAFRLIVEPEGIRSPKFEPDMAALKECRKQQEMIAGGGFQTMTPIELFETNALFHETVAAWSKNRFIIQTVRRLNQLRRLVEYRQAKYRPLRKIQVQEHLLIISSLAVGDLRSAADRMREHLEGARREKVSAGVLRSGEAG